MPTINANGIELAYDLVGPEGAPVVAFSNSLGSTMEMWDGVIPGIAGRYRCLRYDARAHGRSGSSDAPTTIDDLVADLAGLLDALQIDRAHIAGLSLGGMTAQAFAIAHPRRTASLTLLATGPYLPPPEFWLKRAATVRAEGLAAVVDTIVPRWFTPAFREADPAAVARTRASFLRSDPGGYARCCEVIAAADLRERIAAISAPTLILAGADDPVTNPAMADDMRRRIPGSEMTVLPDVAHLMAVERPDAVAAHLAAFLARHAGATTPHEDTFQRGLAIRKSVLGAGYVEASLAVAGAFGMPWQDFITRVAWNDVWGDPTLPRKTRSLLTLVMMVALHREEEFKLHIRPAIANGVSIEEMRAMVIQAAAYTGIPAGNAAIRWMRDVLGDELK